MISPLAFVNGRVLGCSLAMSFFLAMQAHSACRKAARDLVGAIGGAVGRYDDLEMRLGIIERERVFKFGGEVALLVVGRDDDCNRRCPVTAADRASV